MGANNDNEDGPGDHVLEGQQCPQCRYKMDRASDFTGEGPPKPGDFSMCFNCGALNLFDEGLKLREPDPMELLHIELSKDWPKVQKGQRIIRERGRMYE